MSGYFPFQFIGRMRPEQFMETVCSELFVPPQLGAVNDQSPVVVDERNPVDPPLRILPDDELYAPGR